MDIPNFIEDNNIPSLFGCIHPPSTFILHGENSRIICCLCASAICLNLVWWSWIWILQSNRKCEQSMDIYRVSDFWYVSGCADGLLSRVLRPMTCSHQCLSMLWNHHWWTRNDLGRNPRGAAAISTRGAKCGSWIQCPRGNLAMMSVPLDEYPRRWIPALESYMWSYLSDRHITWGTLTSQRREMMSNVVRDEDNWREWYSILRFTLKRATEQ